MSTKIQAKPLFAATLTPHRSLTPNGQRWVIALVIGFALIPGLTFFSLGAWPIVGFMGLDVVAIILALTLSMRSGRTSEVVTLWPNKLELKKIDPKGREARQEFNPVLIRLIIDRDINERTTALWLRAADDKISLGAFLSLDEKASFAKVFGTALRKARH